MAASEPSPERRAAIFTVSPQRSKLNLLCPTTPATTGPTWMPTRSFHRAAFWAATPSIASAQRTLAITGSSRGCRRGSGDHETVADGLDLLEAVRAHQEHSGAPLSVLGNVRANLDLEVSGIPGRSAWGHNQPIEACPRRVRFTAYSSRPRRRNLAQLEHGWRRTIGATAGVGPRSSHYDQEGAVCDWRAAMPPTSRAMVLAQDFLDNTIVTAKGLLREEP